MQPFPPTNLPDLAEPSEVSLAVRRRLSIWEITSWIMPMAPEHFRRVLAAEPHLPQGTADGDGGTRWFSQEDLSALRAHFARGPRKGRYQPSHSPRAPLVTLAGPLGSMGRTVGLLHLAVRAALHGYRVLVIDGDAAGTLSNAMSLWDGSGGPVVKAQGALSLIARSAALHLRLMNQARLDRGDAPQPMDDALTTALNLTVSSLIRPSHWPGLDVMPLDDTALLGDVLIAGWQQTLRGWQPSLGFGAELEVLRESYDLILCDTPRGLGPLALSLLSAADILLAPLPLREGALPRLARGLESLAEAKTKADANAQSLARALGQTPPSTPPQQLLIMPTRAGLDAPRLMAGFAAKLGEALLPEPLPEVEAVASGKVSHLYDLDYRTVGRLAYAPLRQASDVACLALAKALTGFVEKP